MLLGERLEIRFDENLNGLFAGINLDPNRRVAEIDLVALPVLSSNDGCGIVELALGDRRRHQVGHLRPAPPQADALVIIAWNGAGGSTKVANRGERPTIT